MPGSTDIVIRLRKRVGFQNDADAKEAADEIDRLRIIARTWKTIAEKGVGQKMDRATELPIKDCDLAVTVGSDGVWLHFGAYAAIHVANTLCERQGVFYANIAKWCVSREEQAKQIRADNGQFGVGA